MHFKQLKTMFVAMFLLLTLAGCTFTPRSVSASDEQTMSAPETVAKSAPIPDSEFDILPDYDPNNFGNSTLIDNQWFPIAPGTRFIYEGTTVEEGEEIPHRIIFTATDLTKEIAGIRAVVMWDRDFSDGELVEAEIALYAQDNDGNIWHFGQYPEEYEDGEVVATPAWLAGFEEAQPGITVKAEPEIGGMSYSQGWGPTVGWTDRARAVRFEDGICVPTGCYDGVLVTEETARDEDSFQLKYYAPGVGNIFVSYSGDDATKEILQLIEIVQMNEAEMAEARTEALALEARAYANVPTVFGATAPME